MNYYVDHEARKCWKTKDTINIDNQKSITKISIFGYLLNWERYNLDKEYLDDIHDFLKENGGKTFTVEELTDDEEKFREHIMYYIGHSSQRIDWVDVCFNDNYTKIKITNDEIFKRNIQQD